jgi:hypothetical protein
VDAGGRGFVDEGLWSTELGQRYLEAQKDAVYRRVKIRRIFIFNRPDLRDEVELQEVIREHHDAGIIVRTLDPSTVGILRQPLLLDFIVFDSVLVYMSSTAMASLNSDRRPRIVSTRLVTNPARVSQDVARYEVLWEAATPYQPLDQ